VAGALTNLKARCRLVRRRRGLSPRSRAPKLAKTDTIDVDDRDDESTENRCWRLLRLLKGAGAGLAMIFIASCDDAVALSPGWPNVVRSKDRRQRC
jgi:hypothetical protein